MLRWINNSLNKNPAIEIPKEDLFQTDNIPGKILQLQFQCESESATKELIAKLTSLYTQAVEYYESNNDKRYRVYQRRLERFLKKQNIDDILRGKSGELVSKKDTAEKQIIHAVTKSKSEVGKLIDRSQKITHLNLGLLENSLKKQEKNLNERMQRRKAMSNRSSRTRDDQDNEEGKTTSQHMKRNLVFDELTERTHHRLKKVFI